MYKVLLDEGVNNYKRYKGIYRSEPFPVHRGSVRFMELWNRYNEYYENGKDRGIVNELSLEELFEYARLASAEFGDDFEVIYFDYDLVSSTDLIGYGFDVIGVGGYSYLAEPFIERADWFSEAMKRELLSGINQYGLFDERRLADTFRDLLLHALENNINIEAEEWEIVYVAKVMM